MNDSEILRQQENQHQSNDATERGAATETATTLSGTITTSSRNENMKVQDRIHAMNKVIDQDELLEPLEMIISDSKSPGSYPKRSSVVEMWKKREGTIKKATTNNYNKFEEKKEVHPSDDGDDNALQPFESADSDRDARQQDKMTPIYSQLSAASSSSRIVTPERSGPESDDSSSNFGTGVRRSNIRQSWKKKAPLLASYSSPAKVDQEPVNVSADSTSCSPDEEHEPLTVDVDADPVEYGVASHTIPASPSPSGHGYRAVRSNSWRTLEEFKPHQAPVTPRSNPPATPSSIRRSHSRDSGISEQPSNGNSAFDELRSKWAKFGVQQEQAGTAGRVRPASSTPVPITMQSPKASHGIRKDPLGQRKETERQESSSRPASPKAEGSSPMIGGRKSHLVKMGQMHAARPKAEISGRANSPITRFTPSKHSPKSSNTGNDLADKPGAAAQPNFIKRNTFPKNIDAKSLLRAKHLRRAQQAQTVSAAAVPQSNAHTFNHTNMLQDSSEDSFPQDSFPLDEMGPDSFGNQSRDTGSDTMIRTSLPMRTLFGSQSGESLELGPSNEKFNSYLPDPRHVPKTDVMKTTFDSWSDIESFSADGPQNASNDSGSGKTQPSSSSLTNSALKRLREKRQQNTFSKPNGSDKYHVPDMEEPETPQSYYGAQATSEKSATSRSHPSPGSLNDSSAISQSICSDTSYSNSYMQSTYASGYTKETAAPTVTSARKIHNPLKDVVPHVKEMIPDEFVSEKNASVQSFRTAYENLSLEQIARDMKEEATSVLSIDFLNPDLLNKSMNAAGASFNKLVAGEMFQKQNQRRLIKRATSPVEEVAIEVEYIADSEDDP